MRTVIIIENDKKEFNIVKEIFEASGWKILPRDFDEIRNLYTEEKKNDLLNFVAKLIKENYNKIDLIVLDINLWGRHIEDTFGIDGVLKSIREADIPDNSSWAKQVPIIAYSRFDDIEYKRKALGQIHHVHTYIAKSQKLANKEELLLTAESLASIFNLNMEKGGFEENLNYIYRQLTELIERQGEGIGAKFNDMQVFIKGETDLIQNSLQIVIRSILLSLDDDDVKKILDEYYNEINEIVGEEKYMVIRKELNRPDIIEQLTSFIKKGQFSDLIDFTKELLLQLHNDQLIDLIPGGKIIILCLSAILKILSRSR